MSEVNADGVLLNPHEAILQEVQALSNALMAETPAGMEDDMEHEIEAATVSRRGWWGELPICRRPRRPPAERTSPGGPACRPSRRTRGRRNGRPGPAGRKRRRQNQSREQKQAARPGRSRRSPN